MRIDNLDIDQIRKLGIFADWAEHYCEYKAVGTIASVWNIQAKSLAILQADLRERYEEITGHAPHLPTYHDETRVRV